MARLLDVSQQGRTIIMVSHQMSYLRDLCQTGFYLNTGALVYQGTMNEVIDHYVSQYSKTQRANIGERIDRRGSGVVRLTDFDVLDHKGYPIHTISAGQPVSFRMALHATIPEAHNVVIQLEFFDIYGQLCFVSNNSYSNHSIPKLTGNQTIECRIPKFPLQPHSYFVNAGVHVMNQLADEILNVMSVEVEPGMFYPTGKMPPSNKGFLVDYEWTY
jgi:hypothetical protein